MNSDKKDTMTISQNKKNVNAGKIVILGLLTAMSIVLGKMLAFNIGINIRISFENLPILMAGIFFGPVSGVAVGLCADIIGCIIAGYAINPLITLGGMAIGLLSGLVSQRILKSDSGFIPYFLSVFSAHAVGSMLIKSIGLHVYYGTPLKVLVFRIPLYIGIGILETYIIYLLRKNKAFSEQLERMCKKNGRLQ